MIYLKKTSQLILTNDFSRFLLIAYLLIYSQLLYSQDYKNVNIILKFHPLPALNVGIPRVQGSVEFRFKEKFGIEFGYGKRYLDNNIWIDEKIDTTTIKPSGDIKMLDFNFYNLFQRLHKQKGNLKMDNYIGLSFKRINDIRNKMTKYWPDNSNILHTDCYAIKKTVYVYTMKFGIIVSYKRIGAEGFGEFGLRYKNQYLVKSEMDMDNDSSPDGLWFWDAPYKGFLPHLNIGLKINYRIL